DPQVLRALGQPVRLLGQCRRRGRGDSCCEGVIGVVADCSDEIPTALQPPQAASFCGLDAMAVPSGLIESSGGQTLEHTVSMIGRALERPELGNGLWITVDSRSQAAENAVHASRRV